MLYWAAVFFVIALIAALFGFTGIAVLSRLGRGRNTVMVDLVESHADAPAPERVVTVLAVSDSEDDHGWLAEIFRHSRWKMLSARSCREAFEILQTSRIPVGQQQHERHG